MKKKNIVVLYKGTNKEHAPLQHHPELREYMMLFSHSLKEIGITTYFSHSDAYKNKFFLWGWKIENNEFRLVSKKFPADAVYDRNRSESILESEEKLKIINSEVPTINNIDLKVAIASKISQQIIFGEYLPKGWVLQNKKDLQKLWENTNINELVIKPEFGMGGLGVTLLKRNSTLPKDYSFPCVAQKRLDGKIFMEKIPKNRIGDIRVVVNCGKIIYAFSRLAPTDSFITNVKQGGNAIFLEKKELPESILEIVKKVNKKLEIFGNAEYCVDMMFHKGKPYLVEVNMMPGVVSLISQKKHSLIKKQIAAQISMLTSMM